MSPSTVQSVLLVFLGLTRIILILGAALAGFLFGPLAKVKRITGACLAALAVVLLDDLYFLQVGASPWRWLILLPLALVPLAPWVIAPLKVARRRFPWPRIELRPFDPGILKPGSGSDAWVRRSVEALTAEGFTAVADVVEGMLPGKLTRYVVMDHATEGTRALLQADVAAFGVDDHLALDTVLADGTPFVVNNSRLPRDNPPLPDRVGVQLPDVRDTARLLAAFRGLAARRAGDLPRSLPPGADAAAYLEQNSRTFVDAMLACGWYRRAGDGYRLSLRAAFTLSSSLLFPMRQIRIRNMRRKQDRELREIGMPPVRDGQDGTPAWWLSFGGLQAAGAAVLLLFGVMWPFAAGRGGYAALLPLSAKADTVIPARLPRGFAVPADSPGAVAALELLTGAPARPLTADDGFSGVPSGAVMVPVAKERAKPLLAAAQPEFLAHGFVLFHTQEFSGVHGEPEALAVFPSRDPLAVLLRLNTNGGNYGIGPDEVVAWLRQIGREHPLTITSAGFDYLEARFRRPLSAAEARAMAARVARFCPDVVTQGTGSVHQLAAEIRQTQSLYCWWD